jgi:transmembrane sensor
VTHDTLRPFRVHAGSTVIEDLGTEFAVRAYEPARSVRVAVASGSVAVRRGTNPTPSVVLSPRDVAIVGDTGEVRLTRGADLSQYTAWTGGRLVFDDTPLAQVAEELERWYGVEVRVTDTALLSRHLTTAFDSETLDEVLRVIGMSLDVRYVRKGNVVEFTGSGASTGLLKRSGARVETGA